MPKKLSANIVFITRRIPEVGLRMLRDTCKVRLWEVDDGTLLRVLEGHTAEVKSVAFSPDAALLASGAADGTARIWDIVSDTELKTLRGTAAEVNSVSFSPDGRVLAVAGDDGTVRLWGVR